MIEWHDCGLQLKMLFHQFWQDAGDWHWIKMIREKFWEWLISIRKKKLMKDFRNIQLQLSWGEEAAAKWRHWHLSKESGFALLLPLNFQKSCTRWYGKYPIIHRVWYIPSGAELLSSTVSAADFLPEEKLGVVDQSALELPQSDCRTQLEKLDLNTSQ